MNTVINLFMNLRNALRCIGELVGYLLRFASMFLRTKASLAARLVAAESQLAVCKRRIEQKEHPRPRFTTGFRLLWVVLSKLWTPWHAPPKQRSIALLRLLSPRDKVHHVLDRVAYEAPICLQFIWREFRFWPDMLLAGPLTKHGTQLVHVVATETIGLVEGP